MLLNQSAHLQGFLDFKHAASLLLTLNGRLTGHSAFKPYADLKDMFVVLIEFKMKDFYDYVSGDGPGLRDFVISHGVVGPLLKFIDQNTPVSTSIKCYKLR